MTSPSVLTRSRCKQKYTSWSLLQDDISSARGNQSFQDICIHVLVIVLCKARIGFDSQQVHLLPETGVVEICKGHDCGGDLARLEIVQRSLRGRVRSQEAGVTENIYPWPIFAVLLKRQHSRDGIEQACMTRGTQLFSTTHSRDRADA